MVKDDYDPAFDITADHSKPVRRTATLSEITSIIHATAIAKGWWDDTEEFPLRSDGDCIALMHSELSEALEELRNGHDPDEIYFNEIQGRHGIVTHKPEGVPIELADVIIRICDYAGRHGIDLDKAIEMKMNYNATRPARHGGKRL
jgi:NTP pyrophosphatase (non-canonical NTP hydrolase)